jgi:hypothetical protein
LPLLCVEAANGRDPRANEKTSQAHVGNGSPESIPARYVCGYIYTGTIGEAHARLDASHAWVQLYIPNIGRKAFDPTNNILPRTDHVCVLNGRHYRDTVGSLYNSANETLRIDVEV